MPRYNPPNFVFTSIVPRMRLLNIRANDLELERIKTAAAERGMTVTTLIRKALVAQGVDLTPQEERGSIAA